MDEAGHCAWALGINPEAGIRIDLLEPKTCRYPVTIGRLHGFCGEPASGKHSYCEEHHGITYRPPKEA